MVNYNKTFWETRKHVGIPWLKQSIICRNVEYLSALVTLAPRHQSAQTSRLLFRSACTSACSSTATRLPDRAPRASASKSGLWKVRSRPSEHTQRTRARRGRQTARDGTPTAVLIQFCVCSSLIYHWRHEPTSRCLSQSFQQCHLTNSSGLQRLIF